MCLRSLVQTQPVTPFTYLLYNKMIEVILVIFTFTYFITATTGLILLIDEINDYIYYKKLSTDSLSRSSRSKTKMDTAKKKARIALILLIF